jgi:dienelactone hydrolase
MDEVAALSKELEGAGVDYEIQVYSGAPHAFTNWASDRYQKRADDLSWAAFSDFLASNLSK